MATGKVAVSRRWNYCDSSKRGRDQHRNQNYADRGYGVAQRNGFHIPSRVRNLVADEGGLRARSKESETTEVLAPKMGSQDRGQLPQEKKRKFSPIIWDREDEVVKKCRRNDIKVPRECRSSPASVISSPIKSSSESLSDGVSKSPRLLNQAHGSEALAVTDMVHEVPSLLQDEKDTVEHGSLEDGEFVQERNISMSRWASESDSPGDLCMSNDDNEVPQQKDGSDMSPESGEFHMEHSVNSTGSSRHSSQDCMVGQFSGSVAGGLEESDDNYMEDHYASEIEADGHLDTMDCPGYAEVSEVEQPLSLGRGRILMLNSCRSVFDYEKLNKINEGTYGIVFRAKDKETGEIVALKKVKMNQGDADGGFPLSSLREINILLSLNHPSIVNVKEVVMGDLNDVFMVMEYMEHDLKGLMERRKRPFCTSEIKCMMVQLLEGVKYLHDNWVLHRDLKTSNLLMNNQGELKICDLGLSRQYGSPLKPYTPLVVTMWYRAPELLLGTKQYSTAIDMWSVGCIMAELLANEPLFKGNSEINQLDKIFRTLGTPTEKIWPDFTNLPGAKANFVKQPFNLLRKKFPVTSFTGATVLSESGFDLLNRLLTYDPDKRITADEALKHPWFGEVPFPTSKDLMPTFPPQHVVGR